MHVCDMMEVDHGKDIIHVVEDLDKQLTSLLQYQQCSICHEILVKPIDTVCGHTFCVVCIKRSLSEKNSTGCPLCKHEINRRNLQVNYASDMVSVKCLQLVSSFVKEVKELEQSHNLEFLNLKLKTPDSGKKPVKKMKKVVRTNTKKEIVDNSDEKHDIDEVSVVPVVKRDRHMIKYPSVREKKSLLDDEKLISISQVDENITFSEPTSPCPVVKMSKVAVREKVDEWIEKEGDNLLISPDIDKNMKLTSDESKQNTAYTLFRVDYNKEKAAITELQQKPEVGQPDPYEFVASQQVSNNEPSKKKRKTSKRNTYLKKKSRSPAQTEVTASQKFEVLLNETVKQEKRELITHKLFDSFEQIHLADSLDSVSQDQTKKSEVDPPSTQEFDPESVLFKDDLPVEQPRKSCRSSKRLPVDKPQTPASSVKVDLSGLLVLAKPKKTVVPQLEKDPEEKIEQIESQVSSPVKIKNDSFSRSPGWSRVSGLKNEFSQKKRSCMKALNISGGDVSLQKRGNSKDLLSVQDFDVTQPAITKSVDNEESKENLLSPPVLPMTTENAVPATIVEARAKYPRNNTKRTYTFTLLKKFEKMKNPKDSLLILKLGVKNKNSKQGRVKILFPRNFECCNCGNIKTDPTNVENVHKRVKKQSHVSNKSVQAIVNMTEAATSTLFAVTNKCSSVQTDKINQTETSIQTNHVSLVDVGVQGSPSEKREDGSNEAEWGESLILTNLLSQPVKQTARRSLNMDTSVKTQSKSLKLPDTWNDCSFPQIKSVPIADDLDSQLRQDIISTWEGSNREVGKSEKVHPQNKAAKKCFKRIRQIKSDNESSDEDEDAEKKKKVKKDEVKDDEFVELSDCEVDSQKLINQVFDNIKSKEEIADKNSEESDCDIFEQTPPPHDTQWATISTTQFNKSLPKIDVDNNKDSEQSEILATPLQPTQKLDFPTRNSFFKKDNNEAKPSPFVIPGERAIISGKTQPAKHQTQKYCLSTSRPLDNTKIQEFVNKFHIKYSALGGPEMTHLVVGLHKNEDNELTPLCTQKLLTAIAFKKWVVSEQWISDSLTSGRILPEDNYECKDPNGGDSCRRSRTSNKLLFDDFQFFMHDLCKGYFKHDNFKIEEFIEQCGGQIVSDPDLFSGSKMRVIIVPGDVEETPALEKQRIAHTGLFHSYRAVVLSHLYIVQSIESYSLENMMDYLECHVTDKDLIEAGFSKQLVEREEDSQHH